MLAQSVEDFEITLLDDGASDEYRDYVRDLGDARVRYQRNPTRRGAMDAVLGAVFGAEVPLLARGARFPIGVSLFCLGRKPRPV